MALLRTLLDSVGLYERLRYSPLYGVYSRIAHREFEREKRREMRFYDATLEARVAGALVFDIGANAGFKTEVFLRLGARVVAVEPDAFNAARLRKTFGRTGRVSVVEKAVSDREGRAELLVFEAGSAYNTLQVKWANALLDERNLRSGEISSRTVTTCEVETTTLAGLVAQFGPPLYIKVDAEGHESSIIRGMDAAVPFLSFEVNLPEFRDESIECLEHLDRLSHGGVRFNVPEGSDWLWPEWQNASDVKRWLGTAPRRYLEIYAQTRSAMSSQ